MSIIEHLQKIKQDNDAQKARRQTSGKNIWHNWKDGDQVVRFVGDVVITKTYWIAKSNFNKLALFPDSAFEGEGALPKTINCANWNIETEKFEDKGDILSLLNKIAREVLKVGGTLDAETKDKFELLKRRTDTQTTYRWNIIDRDEPKDENGQPKGYLITNIGFELFDDLMAIHGDYQPSLFTSPDEGIDIKVSKTINNGNTKSRADPLLKRGSMVISPLTEEERQWELLNIKDICGKQTDQDLLFSKLLPEWQDLINDYRSNEGK